MKTQKNIKNTVIGLAIFLTSIFTSCEKESMAPESRDPMLLSEFIIGEWNTTYYKPLYSDKTLDAKFRTDDLFEFTIVNTDSTLNNEIDPENFSIDTKINSISIRNEYIQLDPIGLYEKYNNEWYNDFKVEWNEENPNVMIWTSNNISPYNPPENPKETVRIEWIRK